MFYASKLLSFATQPLNWVAVLFAVALLCVPRKRTLGLGLGWASLGLLLLLGWQPLPDALLRRLEAQHPLRRWMWRRSMSMTCPELNVGLVASEAQLSDNRFTSRLWGGKCGNKCQCLMM